MGLGFINLAADLYSNEDWSMDAPKDADWKIIN